jgi:hypothetical protein
MLSVAFAFVRIGAHVCVCVGKCACAVEVEVRQLTDQRVSGATGLSTGSLDDVYAVLADRCDTGVADLAQSHDKHQP